jgi:CRISPR type IV-associated protein Csf2
MKRTIKLSGTIEAKTGIAITRPNDNFMGGGYTDKTARLPRAGAKRQDTPVFIPGATLLGSLRRAAQNRVEAYLQDENQGPVFDLAEHYMLRQGVDITGNVVKEKSAGTIDKESPLRSENPFISLFGRWRLSGHCSVSGLYPINNDCLVVDGKGARSNDFIRTPERIGLLTPQEQEKLQKILEDDASASLEITPINEQIKTLKKAIKLTTEADEKMKLQHEIDAMQQQITQVKNNKSTREAIQRPLDGYEAIKPGTVFNHEIILQNVTEDELGLFLEALAEFTRSPKIGGHSNHGYGQISMNYELTTFPRLEDHPIKLGSIEVSDKGFILSDLTDDKYLEQSRNAFVTKIKKNEFDFGKYLLD